MYSLEAKIRTDIAKVARENGLIPANVYGKDTPSTMIAVGVSEFIKVYRSAGKNHVITLSVMFSSMRLNAILLLEHSSTSTSSR